MGSSQHCRMPVSDRAIIASKGIIGVSSKSGNMAYLCLSIVTVTLLSSQRGSRKDRTGEKGGMLRVSSVQRGSHAYVS